MDTSTKLYDFLKKRIQRKDDSNVYFKTRVIKSIERVMDIENIKQLYDELLKDEDFDKLDLG